jgi:hypothetical protein
MWYRRFVSWLRSLFTTSTQVNGQPTAQSEDALTPPMATPLREAFSARDQSAPQPPPIIERPPHREPPTTVPLARFALPSQPIKGVPPGGDSGGPRYVTSWGGYEPSPPKPPSQPSQPPSDALRQEMRSDPSLEDGDRQPDNGAGDDEALAIAPGSDLYRRLMILRQLVRHRVYNEGFPSTAIPEQYRRDFGQGALDEPPNTF